MAQRRSPRISTRKEPQQARSAELVAAVLEAALQVLAKEGAPRFTMARVAERAGVSVGSLYQYFPNKAAVLFRLQSDEWRRTGEMLRALLEDQTRSPQDRLRRAVKAFLQSECEEAAVRGALDDAAPLYRDAPEAQAARAASQATVRTFLEEALPGVPVEARARAEALMKSTLGAVAKEFSDTPRTPAEIDAFGDAMADMLCAYLDRLAARGETA